MTSPCRSDALDRAKAEAFEDIDASQDMERPAADRAEDLNRAEAAFLEYFLEDIDASQDMERPADDGANAPDRTDEDAAADLAGLDAALKRWDALREKRQDKLAARGDNACDGYLSSVWINDSFIDGLIVEARDPDCLRRSRRSRRGLREIVAELWGGRFGRLRRGLGLYQSRYKTRGVPIDEAGARRLVAMLAEAQKAGLIVPNCTLETSLERVNDGAYDAELHAKRLDAMVGRTVAKGYPAPLVLKEWPAMSRKAPNRDARDPDPGTTRRPRRTPREHVERGAFIVVALSALESCGLLPQKNVASDGVSGADIVACQLNVRPGVHMTSGAVLQAWFRARKKGHFVLS